MHYLLFPFSFSGRRTAKQAISHRSVVSLCMFDEILALGRQFFLVLHKVNAVPSGLFALFTCSLRFDGCIHAETAPLVTLQARRETAVFAKDKRWHTASSKVARTDQHLLRKVRHDVLHLCIVDKL